MAYISQEDKKALAPKIKSILKQYGLKGSLSIRHHPTLVLNIARAVSTSLLKLTRRTKRLLIVVALLCMSVMAISK